MSVDIIASFTSITEDIYVVFAAYRPTLSSIVWELIIYKFRVNKIDEFKRKLENVEINHVLPKKAARRYAIANVKCFWGPETLAT